MHALLVSLALSSTVFPIAASAAAHPGPVPFRLAQDPPEKELDIEEGFPPLRLSQLKLRAAADGAEGVLEEINAERARLKSALEELPALVNGKENPAVRKLLDREMKLRDLDLAIRKSSEIQTGTSADEASQNLLQTVKNLLIQGNHGTLNAMGPAIYDVVAKLILDTKDTTIFAFYETKPLDWLAGHSHVHTLAVARQILKRDGIGWHRLVASSLSGFEWVQPGMTAELAERSEEYALMKQLVESTEVGGAIRAGMLAPFLRAGVANEFTMRAARSLYANLNDKSAYFFDSRVHWLYLNWLEDADSAVRSAAASTLSRDTTPALLERLSRSPHPEVRQHVPLGLDSFVRRGVPMAPWAAELLERCLLDPSELVREAAYVHLAGEMTGGLSSRKLLCPLPPLSLVQTLIERLEDPQERALAQTVDLDITNVIDTSIAGPELGKTLALLLSSGSVRHDGALSSFVRSLLGNGKTQLALIEHFDWSMNRDGGFDYIYSGLSINANRLPTDYCLASYARLIRKGDLPWAVLSRIATSPVVGTSLNSLDPGDAVAVLVHPRLPDELVRFFLPRTDWKPAKVQLEAAARQAEGSGRGRVMARCALKTLSSWDAEDRRALLTDFIAMPSGSDELASMIDLVSSKAMTASLDRALLFQLLLQEQAIGTDALRRFARIGFADNELSEALKVALVDGMEARVQIVPFSGDMPFTEVAYDCLRAMAASPETLFRECLVQHWTHYGSNFTVGAKAAKAAGREDLVEQILAELVRKMNSRTSDYFEEGLAELASFPGNASAQATLILARLARSSKGREAALNQVRSLAEIAELSKQFEGDGGDSTKAEAVERVVGLLESPLEIVRVEAIRSIATLGAVEYIPELIVYLVSGSEAERNAARSALDVLHAQVIND